jgi:hypothetical protein
MVNKTREIVAWARTHAVPVTLAARVWQLYVIRGVLYGAALCTPTKTALQSLDRAHRHAARLLLGYSASSPCPATLAEVGWIRITALLPAERGLLLGRILRNENTYIAAAAEYAARTSGSWLEEAVEGIRRWDHTGFNTEEHQWKRMIKQCRADTQKNEIQSLIRQCDHHAGLTSYQCTVWAAEHKWGINNFLHNTEYDTSTSKAISRLICGGQGLRGGDVAKMVRPTKQNCCVFCLERGMKAVESLTHIIFECPDYQHLRNRPGMSTMLMEKEKIFAVHRNHWSWKQLKLLHSFFYNVTERRTALAGGSSKRGRKKLAERAEVAWMQAGSAIL